MGDEHDGAAGRVAGRRRPTSRRRSNGCPGCRSARRPGSRTGSVTMARATATRCCWPPDISFGRWSMRSAKPDLLQGRDRPARRRSLALTPAYVRGSSTLASAVVRGIRLKLWNTKPILRLRTGPAPTRRGCARRRRRASTGPWVGTSRQPMMFIRVDLPGARRAHDGHELAALDDEGDASQGLDLDLAQSVGLGDVAQGDDRERACRSTPLRLHQPPLAKPAAAAEAAAGPAAEAAARPHRRRGRHPPRRSPCPCRSHRFRCAGDGRLHHHVAGRQARR